MEMLNIAEKFVLQFYFFTKDLLFIVTVIY